MSHRHAGVFVMNPTLLSYKLQVNASSHVGGAKSCVRDMIGFREAARSNRLQQEAPTDQSAIFVRSIYPLLSSPFRNYLQNSDTTPMARRIDEYR